MATLAIPVLCFLLAFMQKAGGSLVMDVNPTDVISGLTKSLTINCSFSFDGVPNLSGIISLIISKENQQKQFDDLVSLNVFTPNVLTGADKVNGTVTGLIDEDTESFLSIEWPFPSLDEGGLYQCQLNGVDNSGHPTQEVQTMMVTSEKPDLDQLIGKVSDLQRQLDRQGTLVQNQSQTINTLLSLVQAQSNTITDMKIKLNSQNRVPVELAFTISTEYQGHYYMLSKEDWNDAKISEKTCEDYGGYLAEINDSDEQEFVKEFVDSLDGFPWVLISGTEEGHEGSWTYFPSGSPLTYTDWYGSEPDSANAFCIAMYRGYSWRWRDYYCTHTHTNYKFLCEANIH